MGADLPGTAACTARAEAGAGGAAAAAAAGGWRPRLEPVLRPTWRGPASVQFGLDPVRAIVVDGISESCVRLLVGLDGRRTEEQALAVAAAAGLDAPAVRALLADLRRAGVLTDGGVPEPSPAAEQGVTRLPLSRVAAAQRIAGAARLAPDRAALALLGSSAGADQHPDAVLTRRRHAAVVVHGAGRVGAPLATLLGAAGVGHVHLVDPGRVRPADLAPGGAGAPDLHERRDEVAAAAVRRAAPEVGTSPLPRHRPADLVVLAGARPLDENLVAGLHQGGTPHLVVGIRETTAVVGPLVLPGRTACLRCTDLHRADRDPAWPLIAAQLSTPLPPLAGEACDVVLAALAAALGAAQALCHLAGEAVGALGGSLELATPGWQVRRRGWPPHPACDCGAAEAGYDPERATAPAR